MRPVEACPVCGSRDLRPFAMDRWDEAHLHFAQARCHGCGLLAAQPQATEEELSEYYTRQYYEQHPLDAETHWAQNHRDYPRYELPALERLWAGFAPPPGALAGEIGCGHGSLLSVLGERGFGARGCELSPSAARFCRDKGLDVIDGRDFPPETKGAFDLAVSFQVIEHVTDPRAFVRRMIELVKPGGVVAITTENAWTSLSTWNRVQAWARGEVAPYRTSSEHTFVFQGKHLERLLREEGCDVARASGYQRGAPNGRLHFRLYKGAFQAVDRLLGCEEYLAAAGRRAAG